MVGGVVSWKNEKYSMIATSTMKVEFVVCLEVKIQELWLLHLTLPSKKIYIL
jgi:hypothetical protein